MTARPAVNWRGIGVYVLLAYGLMWLVCLPLWVTKLSLASPGGTLLVAVAMFIPALSSWLTCRFVDHRPWLRRAGLRSSASVSRIGKFSLVAFGIVFGYLVIAVALAAATGLLHLDLIRFSGASSFLAGLPTGGRPLPPPGLLVGLYAAETLIASFSVNAFAALGEEVGWRGYLLPELLALGRVPALIVSGTVWALWHLPIILVGYEYPGSARPLAVALFVPFCILFGTMLSWLRLRTDSPIPSAVGHGTLNGWIRMLPLLVAAGRPLHWVTSSPLGLTGFVVLGAVATLLLTRVSWTPSAAAPYREPAEVLHAHGN